MGFAFARYLPLVQLMMMAGFAGTALGGSLLTRVPEQVFRLVFCIPLSLVALELIRRAVRWAGSPELDNVDYRRNL